MSRVFLRLAAFQTGGWCKCEPAAYICSMCVFLVKAAKERREKRERRNTPATPLLPDEPTRWPRWPRQLALTGAKRDVAHGDVSLFFLLSFSGNSLFILFISLPFATRGRIVLEPAAQFPSSQKAITYRIGRDGRIRSRTYALFSTLGRVYQIGNWLAESREQMEIGNFSLTSIDKSPQQ